MKRTDFLFAQELCDGLETGTARRADVTSLLMLIREDAPEGMIKDIAHCVAHQSRDRGYAFGFINHFLQELTDYFRKGGTVTVRTLFDIEEVLEDLRAVLALQNVRLDVSKVRSHITRLVQAMEEILNQVVLEVDNPNVSFCAFNRSVVDGRFVFGFTVRFVGLSELQPGMVDGVELMFPVFASH